MSDDLSAIFGTPATALSSILPKKSAPPAPQTEPEAETGRTRREEVPTQRTAEPTKPDHKEAPAVQQEPTKSDTSETSAVRREELEPSTGTPAPAQEDAGSTTRTAPPAKRAEAPPTPSTSDRSHSAPAKPKRPTPARTAPATQGQRAARPQPPRSFEPGEELDVEVTSQLSVYVLPEAVQAIRKVRQSTGRLNAEIAFDAIDESRDILPHLVQARQVTPRAEGSLFPARRAARRGRRRISEQQARTLWTIQITQAEYQVLKDLVAETGADSVSQLVSAAVEAYLLDEQPVR